MSGAHTPGTIGHGHRKQQNWDDGRSIRIFNVLEDFNREGLGSEVDFFLPAERVTRALDQIIEWQAR